MKQLKKKQDNLIKELKEAMQDKDWEVVHSLYDKLVELRLRQHEPSFIRRLDRITKGAFFWYA